MRPMVFFSDILLNKKFINKNIYHKITIFTIHVVYQIENKLKSIYFSVDFVLIQHQNRQVYKWVVYALNNVLNYIDKLVTCKNK